MAIEMESQRTIAPPRLKQGDKVRVLAPSRSLSLISSEVRRLATKRLNEMGLEVSFGTHAEECDEFISASIYSRLSDIHEALRDPSVSGILTVIGGFNSNQLLEDLDYDLFRQYPKILCGFSDITALQNAILKKAGVITYSGPHYSTFGMELGNEYTIEHFKKCLFSNAPFNVNAAPHWSDDPWYRDQRNRTFVPNTGPWIVQPGMVTGRIVGGNLCTLNLLQGSPFMPDFEETLLFLEDDETTNDVEFDRDLQSILHLPSFSGVRGIVFGRFQRASGLTTEKLNSIVRSKKKLRGLPIIADANFGHTTPGITFPIGGIGKLNAGGEYPTLMIERH